MRSAALDTSSLKRSESTDAVVPGSPNWNANMPGSPNWLTGGGTGGTVNGSTNASVNATTPVPDTIVNPDFTQCNFVDAGYTSTPAAASDRRRRTVDDAGQNLEWDCDFDANYISGNDPCHEIEVPMNTIDDSHIRANPHLWCKAYCLQLDSTGVTCTGFYIVEEGTVQGQGNHKCGFYTRDMNLGTMAVRENSVDGYVCKRIGKNFDCTEDYNFIQTETRADFQLEEPPLLKPDGTVANKVDAMDYCKAACDNANPATHTGCNTFWFQERLVSTVHGNAYTWKCGIYGNAVADDQKILEPYTADSNNNNNDDNLNSGCICSSV